MNVPLSDKNYQLFAARYYTNTNCSDILEFHEDLNRIKYIKRLFKRYAETGDLKERLLVNHLIILYNVFYHQAITQLLLFKLPEYWHYLKPFLLYLNYWPEEIIHPIDGHKIPSSDISMDPNICNVLRKL